VRCNDVRSHLVKIVQCDAPVGCACGKQHALVVKLQSCGGARARRAAPVGGRSAGKRHRQRLPGRGQAVGAPAHVLALSVAEALLARLAHIIHKPVPRGKRLRSRPLAAAGLRVESRSGRGGGGGCSDSTTRRIVNKVADVIGPLT
jgi:hypothetical protein